MRIIDVYAAPCRVTDGLTGRLVNRWVEHSWELIAPSEFIQPRTGLRQAQEGASRPSYKVACPDSATFIQVEVAGGELLKVLRLTADSPRPFLDPDKLVALAIAGKEGTSIVEQEAQAEEPAEVQQPELPPPPPARPARRRAKVDPHQASFNW